MQGKSSLGGEQKDPPKKKKTVVITIQGQVKQQEQNQLQKQNLCP